MITTKLNKSFKALTLLFLLGLFVNHSQLRAQTGLQGNVSISGTNIDVNTRVNLTTDLAAGSSVLSVTNSAMIGAGFTTALNTGDLILIIQMQGATINTSNANVYGDITSYNNAGRYEFRCVEAIPSSTSILVSLAVTNNYTAAGKTQIIRIPRYRNLTIAGGNSIAPTTWNGSIGGVTAIEIENLATINGSINATGTGFRGGANDNLTQSQSMNITSWFSSDVRDGGRKGEGIAGSELDYDNYGGRYGRGAPANGGGGGNSHNAGGGGGANGGIAANWNGLGNPDNSGTNWSTAWNLEGGSFSSNTSSGGGRGGYSYAHSDQNAITRAPGHSSWAGNSRRNLGGYGGRPLDYSGGRLFMGGGGGAGDGNNSAASGGANGGGLIFILSHGSIVGTGFITSNGANAANTFAAHNDAPGGGGGGGTIILSANSIANTLTLNANGGNGGNQLITNHESEGPGGGGGGGYIAISAGNPTRNTSAGVNGTTSSSALTEFIPNGATRGGAGTNNASINTQVNVGALIVNAGVDEDFCGNLFLKGNTPSTNAEGHWAVILGSGGTIINPLNPTSEFRGDTNTIYLLSWTIRNNLCQEKSDTVRLTPDCFLLSLNLLDFQGYKTGPSNNLNWQVSSDAEVNEYVLLRSYDAKNFEKIAHIPSRKSHFIEEYSFLDQLVNNKISTFYKIHTINTNGSESMSDIIKIDAELSNQKFTLFPNPTKDFIHVETNIKFNGTLHVNIYSIHGQLICKLDTAVFKQNQLSIDVSKFQNGMYILDLVQANGKSTHLQFTKD